MGLFFDRNWEKCTNCKGSGEVTINHFPTRTGSCPNCNGDGGWDRSPKKAEHGHDPSCEECRFLLSQATGEFPNHDMGSYYTISDRNRDQAEFERERKEWLNKLKAHIKQCH